MRLRVCRAAELHYGDVRPVELERDARGRPREALVLRDADGEVRAYLNRCEHLPIPLDGGSREFLSLDGSKLMCGTHGALYRLDDGYCTEGPCTGASLVKIPVELDDEGWVELVVGPLPPL